VPALLTDDGVTLTESTAICEYFSRLAGAPAVEGDAWLDLASRTGLAQGLIDASFGIVVERRRPPEAQSSGWTQRLTRAVDRTLKIVRVKEETFDAGDISLACALAYLDFRLAEVTWRSVGPTSPAGSTGWRRARRCRDAPVTIGPGPALKGAPLEPAGAEPRPNWLHHTGVSGIDARAFAAYHLRQLWWFVGPGH